MTEPIIRLVVLLHGGAIQSVYAENPLLAGELVQVAVVDCDDMDQEGVVLPMVALVCSETDACIKLHTIEKSPIHIDKLFAMLEEERSYAYADDLFTMLKGDGTLPC